MTGIRRRISVLIEIVLVYWSDCDDIKRCSPIFVVYSLHLSRVHSNSKNIVIIYKYIQNKRWNKRYSKIELNNGNLALKVFIMFVLWYVYFIHLLQVSSLYRKAIKGKSNHTQLHLVASTQPLGSSRTWRFSIRKIATAAFLNIFGNTTYALLLPWAWVSQ